MRQIAKSLSGIFEFPTKLEGLGQGKPKHEKKIVKTIKTKELKIVFGLGGEKGTF